MQPVYSHDLLLPAPYKHIFKILSKSKALASELLENLNAIVRDLEVFPIIRNDSYYLTFWRLLNPVFNTLMFGWRWYPTKAINVREVPRNHYFKIFLKFWSECFRISRTSWRNGYSLLNLISGLYVDCGSITYHEGLMLIYRYMQHRLVSINRE